MPEWMFGGLITLGIAMIGGGGVLVGHILTRRTSKETTEVQAQATQKTAEHQMIDQLQEELKGYREHAEKQALAADVRASAQDERMNRLERYSDGYRSHAHELRSHIWDQLPPPPPPWPEDLPK